MKKTLLAISVASLFAAASVNAAEIYNQDGVMVDIYGDVEVRLQSDMFGEYDKKNKHGSEANSGYLKLDDADFGFKLAYDINDMIKIGGVVEFSGEGGTADLGDAYVGLMVDKVKITAGKQPLILDDAGIGQDYAFGFDTAIDDNDYSGKQVIKVKADYDMFYGGVSVMLNGDGDKAIDDKGFANSIDNTRSAMDANFGVRVAGLDAAIFYGVAEDSHKSQKLEADLLIAQATYSWESFNLGGFISLATTEKMDVTTNDSSAYGLSGQYLLNDWDFALGFGQVVNNIDKGKVGYYEDYYKSYLNTGYAFSGNVHVFAEVGFSDKTYLDSVNKKQDAEVGFATGIKVNF